MNVPRTSGKTGKVRIRVVLAVVALAGLALSPGRTSPSADGKATAGPQQQARLGPASCARRSATTAAKAAALISNASQSIE